MKKNKFKITVSLFIITMIYLYNKLYLNYLKILKHKFKITVFLFRSTMLIKILNKK